MEVDNASVRQKQVARINKMKAERDAEKVQKSLNKLLEVAKNRKWQFTGSGCGMRKGPSYIGRNKFGYGRSFW